MIPMSINLRNLTNPFFIYAISFTLVFLLYNLYWSNLQQKLTLELVIFLVSTILISLFLGLITKKEALYNSLHSSFQDTRLIRKKSKRIFIIIFIGLYMQFAYEGTIPLLDIINNQRDAYKTFGIPTVSLFALSAGTVISTVFFDFYLQSKNKWFLLYSVVIIFSFLLMFNRGAILITFTQMLLVFFIRRRPKIRTTLSIIVLSLMILFLFGWAGNLRENHSDANINLINSDYIISLGGASDSFIESNIPNEFFWPYLYITTPLANLQNNITYKGCNSKDFDLDQVAEMVINEVFPDFISKRVNKYYSEEKPRNIRINTAFTVGTIYGKSYVQLCWTGVGIMFFFFSLMMYLFLKLSYFRSQTVAAIAVVGSFAFFGIFTNVVAYSAISLQLFWALLLQWSYRTHI